MDIMELGAIGELVGGVAVIASLIFVGMQVRGSTREQRLTAMQQATRETAEVVQFFREPGRTDIWIEGLKDWNGLELRDQVILSAILLHWFRMFEQLFYQSMSGRLESDLWAGFERQLGDFVAYPGCQRWWAERGHWFGDTFRVFVATSIAAASRPSLYGEHGITGPHEHGAGA